MDGPARLLTDRLTQEISATELSPSHRISLTVAEEKQMARRSWENTYDHADRGAAYPGLLILNRWRIACERHLDDLRHETGALEYSNVRAMANYNPTRADAGPAGPS